MIELIGKEPEAKELDSNHEGVKTDEDIEAITHTVYALAGYTNPHTMKIGGTLKHQPITILIDTGSTNNFMDRKVTAQLAHHIEGYDIFEVKIANGWILTCDSKGQEFLAMITTLNDLLLTLSKSGDHTYLINGL